MPGCRVLWACVPEGQLGAGAQARVPCAQAHQDFGGQGLAADARARVGAGAPTVGRQCAAEGELWTPGGQCRSLQGARGRMERCRAASLWGHGICRQEGDR